MALHQSLSLLSLLISLALSCTVWCRLTQHSAPPCPPWRAQYFSVSACAFTEHLLGARCAHSLTQPMAAEHLLCTRPSFRCWELSQQSPEALPSAELPVGARSPVPRRDWLSTAPSSGRLVFTVWPLSGPFSELRPVPNTAKSGMVCSSPRRTAPESQEGSPVEVCCRPGQELHRSTQNRPRLSCSLFIARMQ